MKARSIFLVSCVTAGLVLSAAPVSSAAHRAACTNGVYAYDSNDGGNATSTVDWEAQGSCDALLGVTVQGGSRLQWNSGLVEALELNASATVRDGSGLSVAWAHFSFEGSGVWACQRIWPTLGSDFACGPFRR